MTPDQLEAFTHLKSLSSIRSRCSLLFSDPQKWLHFDYNESKLDDCADYVCNLIARDYKNGSIPMHSRWRHYDVNFSLSDLITEWKKEFNIKEIVVNLLDLFVVSVLLDAGAGDVWKFNGVGRSEGLALAALEMFKQGKFSSNKENKYQCDALGLQSLDLETLAKGFHVSESNPLVGLSGRLLLLQNLGKTIESQPKYFSGKEVRVGNMLDYLVGKRIEKEDGIVVDVADLWEVVVYGLNDVWPSTRTKYEGVGLGDVWPSKALASITSSLDQKPNFLYPSTENLVCFHKLSQWLTYSLMEPLQLYGMEFVGTEVMTGLAEYRNGGFFVDFGVITLCPSSYPSGITQGQIPEYNVDDDVIVEWRALTVALLDLVAQRVRLRLQKSEKELSLVKILEAGTWKAGREIAAKLRPESKGPPIKIKSDGTVF